MTAINCPDAFRKGRLLIKHNMIFKLIGTRWRGKTMSTLKAGSSVAVMVL